MGLVHNSFTTAESKYNKIQSRIFCSAPIPKFRILNFLLQCHSVSFISEKCNEFRRGVMELEFHGAIYESSVISMLFLLIYGYFYLFI